MKKFVTQQQQLFITKTENEFVKQVKRNALNSIWKYRISFFFSVEEFENLDSDAVIYKLVGPVLIKQELDEGKETVEKRLVYCEGEL